MKDSIIGSLQNIVGSANVMSGDAGTQYLTDFLATHHGRAKAIVFPQNTEQVAAVVRWCNETKTPLTPQGGNTSYRAGSVPDTSGDGIVLAMGRMNSSPVINHEARLMTASAGCLLQTLQEEASAAGLFFPLNIGAKGSCQIGGNLSTNAGGLQFLRYGGARELCLGIEAVLPNGDIVNLLSAARKDNSGYDIKNLLIGSEGTLGIITAAALKLFLPPPCRIAAFAAVNNVKEALILLDICQQASGEQMESFELMPQVLLKLLQKHCPQTTQPFAELPPLAILLEAAGDDSIAERMQNGLMKALQKNIVKDVVIATTESYRQRFWQLRELAPEATRREGAWLKLDICLPLQNIVAFVTAAEKMFCVDENIITFGHLGDGNLHLSLRPAADEKTSAQYKIDIIELANSMGGSFGGEHGIGRMQMDLLKKYKPSAAYAAMRAIKAALDPNNIMNPGVMLSNK